MKRGILLKISNNPHQLPVKEASAVHILCSFYPFIWSVEKIKEVIALQIPYKLKWSKQKKASASKEKEQACTKEKHTAKTHREKKKKRDIDRNREQQAVEEHVTLTLGWDFISPFLL